MEGARPPFRLEPVTVVTGHYGVGKTNLSVNMALDAAAAGAQVVLADMDVVNPYFRSSDYRAFLEERGVRVIAPLFAGTTLDSPGISNEVATAVTWAQKADGRTSQGLPERLLIVDAGGDDVGATAFGRFARAVEAGPYAMLYVVNRSRNLTQEPAEAVRVLREVEAKSRLRASAVANNTHLKQETDVACVEAGQAFAREVARLSGLPLCCTTVPQELFDRESTRIRPSVDRQALYPVRVYVRTPWE